jgi:hypothetical protein
MHVHFMKITMRFTRALQHNCSVPVLYCASPESTASTHSYKMKYQDTKVFITMLDQQIRKCFYNSSSTKLQLITKLKMSK